MSKLAVVTDLALDAPPYGDHASGGDLGVSACAIGRVQQLLAPGHPSRGRSLDLRGNRTLVPGSQVRDVPRHSATDRQGADGEGDGGHRPYAGSRHRSRLERPARQRHALGSAHDARGEQGRGRTRFSPRLASDSSSRSCRATPGEVRSPPETVTKARTSSAGGVWRSASSFATMTKPPAPTPGLAAYASPPYCLVQWRAGPRPLGATRRNHTPVIRFLQPARLFPKKAPASAIRGPGRKESGRSARQALALTRRGGKPG